MGCSLVPAKSGPSRKRTLRTGGDANVVGTRRLLIRGEVPCTRRRIPRSGIELSMPMLHWPERSVDMSRLYEWNRLALLRLRDHHRR